MTRPAATEETACNLCGARDYEVIGRADRRGRPLRTVMCRACGLAWINPRPTDDAMDSYYETEYRADYTGAAAPPLRKILRGIVGAHDRRRALRPLFREGASVLDVGCGAGEFVYLLRREGIDATGLEPGREYADFARRVLGIPVHTATVHTAPIAPESQDVVTMFHSLEHVSDPRRVLGKVRGWLKEGGLAVVEVPNLDSTAQAPSHRFHYAHLYHFTADTLAALGEAAGLRLLRTNHSDDWGNVTCVFRRQSDGDRLPVALGAGAARTRAILAAHTARRHYLTPTPYRRVLERLRRRRWEDRLLRRLRTVESILVWAAEQGDGGGLSLAEAHKSRLH